MLVSENHSSHKNAHCAKIEAFRKVKHCGKNSGYWTTDVELLIGNIVVRIAATGLQMLNY